MNRLPGATYSRAGLLLLTRGVSDPCSIDVSAAPSRTTQSAIDDEARDSRDCEGDDCINDATGPDRLCDSCREDAREALIERVALVVTMALRFVPRRCPVRVIETTGVEIREAV